MKSAGFMLSLLWFDNLYEINSDDALLPLPPGAAVEQEDKDGKEESEPLFILKKAVYLVLDVSDEWLTRPPYPNPSLSLLSFPPHLYPPNPFSTLQTA
jgi:hypothetical protein